MLTRLEQVRHQYGPLKKGQDCKVIKEGFDYFYIRLKGRGFYVPKWVFER